MQRRNFLGNLMSFFGITALPISLKAVTPENLKEDNGYLRYKGFLIKWTGWKHIDNSDIVVSQWVAYGDSKHNPKSLCFYASYPGGAGNFWRGQIFDISVHNGQEFPTCLTSTEKLEEYRLEAFHRLISLL